VPDSWTIWHGNCEFGTCSVTRRRSGEGRPGGAGLRRLADVEMVQTTDFGNLHDRAYLGPRNGPDVRCILVEREVSSGPVIVGEVARQDAA